MDAIKEGMLASAKAAEAAARVGERLFGQNTSSVMNFKSQICTDRSQSERLMKLGLKKETADMVWLDHAMTEEYEDWKVTPVEEWDDWNEYDIPAWSLHRLLRLIAISLNISNGITIALPYDIPFDDCIERIEHLIKEGYFNKEYLEE